MADDQIDSIIARPAIEAEVSYVAAKIKEIEELIANAKTQGVAIMSASNRKEFDEAYKQMQAGQQKLAASTNELSEAVKNQTKATQANVSAIKIETGTLEQNVEARRKLQNATASLKQDQKEDLELLRAGSITRKEYTQRLNESTAKIEVNKAKTQDLNKAIKGQLTDARNATNQYAQLSKQYNEAALTAKNLTLQLGKNHPEALAATKNAKALGTQLKDLDSSVGQSQRNVGNYASAFGKAFSGLRTLANILPGIGISGLVLGLYEGVTALLGFSDSVSSASIVMARFETDIDNVTKNLDKLKEKLDFEAEAQKLFFTLQNGKGAESDLFGIKQDAEASRKYLTQLDKDVEESRKRYEIVSDLVKNSPAQALTGLKSLIYRFQGDVKNIPLALAENLSDTEKNLLTVGQKELKLQEELGNKRTKFAQQYTIEQLKNLEKEKEDREKKLKDYTEKERKAALELFKFRQGLLIQEQKDIVNRNTGNIRNQAREKQAELEKKLIEGVAEYELAQKELTASGIDLIEAKETKDLADAKTQRLRDLENFAAEEKAIIEKSINEETELAQKLGEEQDAKDKQNRIDNLTDSLESRLRAIEDSSQKELRVQADLYAAGKISKQKYEKEKNDIEHKALVESIKAQIAHYQNLILISDLPIEVQKEAFAKLRELRKKLNDEEIKDEEDKTGKLTDIQKKRRDAAIALAQEVADLGVTIFEAGIERQKNAIQDLIDALETQKQKDIEVANQTIVNAQDRAAAVALIEARAAAQKEQLEQRQRLLDQKKAKFERAAQIAKIIGDTASAVAQALPDIPLAILVGAIGAAQIAKVLATPIPKYKYGTDNHPGGMAIMGDGGKAEPFVTPDGALHMSGSTPELYNLPAGTVVYPSLEEYGKQVHGDMPVISSGSVMNFSPLLSALDKNGKRVEKAIKNIPQTIVRSEGNWSRYMRKGHNTTTWLNKNL